MFFRRKAAAAPAPAPQEVVSSLKDCIDYNTVTSKKWEVTPEENAFFAALERELRAAHKSTYYHATRMANGAISVTSDRRVYLGKIKLQGKKTWMQYMTSLYDADSVEDEPLEAYMELVRYWVKAAGRRS
jgi:hypothetical protein